MEAAARTLDLHLRKMRPTAAAPRASGTSLANFPMAVQSEDGKCFGCAESKHRSWRMKSTVREYTVVRQQILY